MAVKTFTTGEVLTASDTNTYLANAGLVYVTSTTVGSAVSSVTISNCFSSTYDAYSVVWIGGTASTLGDMRLQLGTTATGYAYNLIYTIYGNTTVQAVTSANDTSWKYIGGVGTDAVSVQFDIYNPNRTYKTFVSGSYVGVTTANGAGQFIGFLNNSTSYTDLKLFVDSPTTLTGGTITVYGYRKA